MPKHDEQMIRIGTPSSYGPHWAGRLCIATLAILISAPAFAIDGAVDVTDQRQTARSGSVTVEAFTRRNVYTVGQRVGVGRHLFLDTNFRTLQELSGTESQGQRNETKRTTLQPSFSAGFDYSVVRLGIDGNWMTRETTSDNDVPDQDRYQLGATMRLDPFESTAISSSWNHSVNEQTGGLTADTENREDILSINLDQRLPKTFDFGYRFSSRSTDIVHRDIDQLLETHSLQLSGSPSSPGGRLRTNWRARSQFFHQRVETTTSGEGRVLLVPIATGLTLDDTPNELDPLEDDPLPVPGLTDGDLDTTTPVDLGDLAPVVREYGGDYRNLQFDLGEPSEFSSAFLYVDTRILLPELFEWQVYVTDDPDGRLWEEVPLGSVTVRYEELGGVRQGWDVSFASPVTARFFKMVDVKLGVTESHIYVTELEVYRIDPDVTDSASEDSDNHRVDAGVSYDLTSNLRVGVQSSVRRLGYDDSSRDLEEVNHTFQSQWTKGRFLASGRYGIYRLWSDSRNDTDVDEYGLALRQGFATTLSTTLSWTHTRDQSDVYDRRTQNLSLLGIWTPSRRLRLSQTVARGTRVDESDDSESQSILARTSFHGSPWTPVTIDLDRTDRWVDEASGSGFEKFHDTTLTVSWLPVPLISLSSYVSYQERATEDWIFRNTATWSPYIGRRTELHLSSSSFSDSRTDNTRYSGEAAIRWRVHMRVTVDGSIETSHVELADETTNPVSTRVHLLWTF
ncbi:MAG: hypothetical protein KDA27_27775 [Candidatus Eisenbacteria bacterium]|uniref:TIGR03016 family PEP-CTERM system-associated outer membrane protein n=1 Tax=Eiseniibacteriota bacterium TaxID=2212470 RepID=A0A956NJ43_UNCEI|nr:hypothetical protein [Candidatus Eisenbacteria bacterium]